ncbi:phosphotransferase [Phascolarctobacterium sp.]|uniref:phosphotransferase n=1 Tax=Phascolarctobacterium sp. TaxID=2049039 RepID=UPI00386F1075
MHSSVIENISDALHVDKTAISDITVLKTGMTNRSYLFSLDDKKYIVRVPGEGTEQLINRRAEAEVYEAIKGRGISDDIIYINPKTGYKITSYLENSRVCNPQNIDDLNQCMQKLRELHNIGVLVENKFDLFEQIEFYESLWGGQVSQYKDYFKTKSSVLKLRNYIEKHISSRVLSHIDAVPDNFLFSDGEVRLIDWEYAGMQDPHVDIAMFSIYAMYSKQQVDRLIDIYFEGLCPNETRMKIYCYIAVCGLLWSNWCEYKRILGVEFGKYSLKQYWYAKHYCKLVAKKLKELGCDDFV